MPGSAVLLFGEWVVVTQPAKLVTAVCTKRERVGGKWVERDASFTYMAETVRDATAFEIAEAKRG